MFCNNVDDNYVEKYVESIFNTDKSIFNSDFTSPQFGLVPLEPLYSNDIHDWDVSYGIHYYMTLLQKYSYTCRLYCIQ